MVKEKGVARSANARADKVNGQYLTKARTLDTECFSSERGARRGGKAHLPEAQIVPQSPRAMRGRLRGSRNAARTSICCYTGGGHVRGNALLAPKWGRIRGGGCRDRLGKVWYRRHWGHGELN